MSTEKGHPNPLADYIQKQKTRPGTPLICNATEYISLGQMMWQTPDGKIVIVDLAMDSSELKPGQAEIRPLVAIARASKI